MAASLLDRIDAEAIDGDLKKALRLCLQLGGVTGSERLREWATSELDGFKGKETIPDYRTVHAPLMMDGQNGLVLFSKQSISNRVLPDFAQDVITEEVNLGQSAPMLVELAREAEAKGAVHLSPPGATDVVAYMNSTRTDELQAVFRIYWSLTPSVVHGVVDAIRSKLVSLVAEMRAGLGPGESLPSAELATQAVNYVVTGEKVKITITQHSSTTSTTGDQKGGVRKALEVLAWIAGIAILVITVLLNWDTITGWF